MKSHKSLRRESHCFLLARLAAGDSLLPGAMRIEMIATGPSIEKVIVCASCHWPIGGPQ
jgi:hypothetical protein